MNTIVLVVDNQTEFFAQVTELSSKVVGFHQTGWNRNYRIYQFMMEEGPALVAWKKLADNVRGYVKYDVYDENGNRHVKASENEEQHYE